MEIIIGRKRYLLTQRRAGAVVELVKAATKIGEDTLAQTIIFAQAVTDSLRSTSMSLPFYKRWKYRRFTNGKGAQYILDNMDVTSLLAAYMKVNELEGNKKKELTTETEDQ